MLPLPIFAQSHRREFTFTPLSEDNPYCPVKFGFLLLARRGVFKINPMDAWSKNSLPLKKRLSSGYCFVRPTAPLKR